MLRLLTPVPDANLEKITTLEVGTDKLYLEDLPARPDYCFTDGEPTDEAAPRDARFCARALPARCGVIAFHDYQLLRPAI
jgi:hypothetical protein